MVRKYVVGVVVVQVVNHKVTRVLEEKVDDMPAIASFECIGAMELAEEVGRPVEDRADMSISIVLDREGDWSKAMKG